MDPISLIGGGLSGLFWLIVPFLVVLSVVVFIHEMGHFLAARFFGVRIEAFSLGFGKELVGWVDRYGTRWRIAALPLGGYVKFWGDADATTSRVNEDALAAATPEQRAGSFHHKPLYQKAVIAAAGPIANFILAIAVFAGLNMFVGERLIPAMLGAVEAGSPAATAGLRKFDKITAVNGTPIRSYMEFVRYESLSTGEYMTLTVDRDGEAVTLTVKPALVDRPDGQGGMVSMPSIGVEPYMPPYVSGLEAGSPADKAGVQIGDLIVSVDGKPVSNFLAVKEMVTASQGRPLAFVVNRSGTDITLQVTPAAKPGQSGKAQYLVGIRNDLTQPMGRFQVETIYHDPLSATTKATADVGFIMTKIGEFLGQLITGAGDYRQLSGPIGIAKVSSDVAQVSLAGLVQLIAVLSVSIGLLNLLPIPILDGGHLLYYAIEAIRGQPLGEKAQEFGFRIGLVFVLGLMLVATWNDIVKVPSWLF